MVEKSHTAGWLPSLYEPFRQVGQKVADWFAPKSEASTSGDAYMIQIELAGVKQEDIDVSLRDNSLTVSGEKRFEHEEKGRTYFFSEREYGAFQRTFRLPPDADATGVDASFSDGVLTIRVPKRPDEDQAREKIAIRKG